MAWQDLAADRRQQQLTVDESWAALEAAWIAAYAAAADLVATRTDPALIASASGEQWLTADEWTGIVDQAGVFDAVNDIVNDGLVATAVDVGVPLDDRTLMSTVTEFTRSITDAVDYLRASVDTFHESALRRQWTPDEFGRALRTSGASPLSAARATRFATGQASGALNAGIRSGIDACQRRSTEFATTANACSDIAAFRWVTQRDERVRPAHAAADTDTVPLGGTFTIDGHPARFPGDPNLPIGLRINCRCYLAWVDGTGVRRLLGATKADLYATAQRLNIEGRSRMSKAELQSALLNELCLQGLAGGPDCPDLFDQMNRSTLMTYARQENIVGRWRMTKRQLVEQLQATMRGGDRIRVAQGFAPAGEFATAQRRATRKRVRAAALELGDDQVPPYRLRRAARRDVFAEFGGDRRGYVPCAFCGLKVNPDPTSGLAVLVPTPIRPFADGGTAALANMLPGCPACFRAHAATRAAASLVASAGKRSEQFDGTADDVEIPEWVLAESTDRTAEFHLKGTANDHDQQSHAGGRSPSSAKTLEDVYGDLTFDVAGSTYRVEIHGIEERGTGDRVRIEGFLVDERDDAAGQFARTLYENGTIVHNDYFEVEPALQGRGIGTTFLDLTEARLAEHGVRQARLGAEDVGKYAWAARGYGTENSVGEVDEWIFAVTDHDLAHDVRYRDDVRALLDHWNETLRVGGIVYPVDLLAISTGFRDVFLDGPEWVGVRQLQRRPARQLAASAPLPTTYRLSDFHLQGQHDQKTHGRRYKTAPSGAKVIAETDADRRWAEREGQGRLSGDGDCYPTAARIVTDKLGAPDEDDYRLVHGVVSGQGDLEGVRFDHAWVERTQRQHLPADVLDSLTPEQRAAWANGIEFVEVIDKSNGNDVTLPRELYYKVGQINPATVRRYTPTEAASLMVRRKHYGPWEDE